MNAREFKKTKCKHTHTIHVSSLGCVLVQHWIWCCCIQVEYTLRPKHANAPPPPPPPLCHHQKRDKQLHFRIFTYTLFVIPYIMAHVYIMDVRASALFLIDIGMCVCVIVRETHSARSRDAWCPRTTFTECWHQSHSHKDGRLCTHSRWRFYLINQPKNEFLI